MGAMVTPVGTVGGGTSDSSAQQTSTRGAEPTRRTVRRLSASFAGIQPRSRPDLSSRKHGEALANAPGGEHSRIAFGAASPRNPEEDERPSWQLLKERLPDVSREYMDRWADWAFREPRSTKHSDDKLREEAYLTGTPSSRLPAK